MFMINLRVLSQVPSLWSTQFLWTPNAIPHGCVMVSQNFSFDFTFQHSGINKVRDDLVPLLLRLHLYGCCCPWTDEFLVWNPQIGRALYIGLDSLTHHVHKRDACRFLSTRSSGKDGCQRQRERFAFGPVYMSPSSSAAFSHVSATTAPSQSSSSHFLLSFSKRATACCWAGDPCRGWSIPSDSIRPGTLLQYRKLITKHCSQVQNLQPNLMLSLDNSAQSWAFTSCPSAKTFWTRNSRDFSSSSNLGIGRGSSSWASRWKFSRAQHGSARDRFPRSPGRSPTLILRTTPAKLTDMPRAAPRWNLCLQPSCVMCSPFLIPNSCISQRASLTSPGVTYSFWPSSDFRTSSLSSWLTKSRW